MACPTAWQKRPRSSWPRGRSSPISRDTPPSPSRGPARYARCRPGEGKRKPPVPSSQSFLPSKFPAFSASPRRGWGLDQLPEERIVLQICELGLAGDLRRPETLLDRLPQEVEGLGFVAENVLHDRGPKEDVRVVRVCLLYTSPSPRDGLLS